MEQTGSWDYAEMADDAICGPEHAPMDLCCQIPPKGSCPPVRVTTHRLYFIA
jgi:hypothetical protein